MFVRFRKVRSRLQCSLIETRREGGNVRHEHVASLGAVAAVSSIADRVAFWAALHRRLAGLSNRVGDADRFKIFEAVSARIPIPTPDEQRQLQRDNAEADERLWSSLEAMNASTAAERRELAVAMERVAAQSEAAASNAAGKAAVARERLARIKRGEDVAGGLGRAIEVEAVMREAGFTKADIRRMKRFDVLITELERRGIDADFWVALRNRIEKNQRNAARQAERDVLRRHRLEWSGDR